MPPPPHLPPWPLSSSAFSSPFYAHANISCGLSTRLLAFFRNPEKSTRSARPRIAATSLPTVSTKAAAAEEAAAAAAVEEAVEAAAVVEEAVEAAAVEEEVSIIFLSFRILPVFV